MRGDIVCTYPNPPPGAVYETQSLDLQDFAVSMEVRVGTVKPGEVITLARDGGKGNGKNGWGVLLQGREEGVFPVFLFTWHEYSINVAADFPLPREIWSRLAVRAAVGEEVEIYIDGVRAAHRSRGQAVINRSEGPFRFEVPPAAAAGVRNFIVSYEPGTPRDEILRGMRAPSLAAALAASGNDARRLETLRME
ncbi:MAG TPA: hypothetical protein PKI32_08170, partial [Opitutales bacterium]|nr:hypothetical protein [Opitutales bacterium]